MQAIVSWIKTADAVVFFLLYDLHVVFFLASLYEVEVHVEVDDCFVAMLVFHINATLSAVNQQVIARTHAADKGRANLLNSVVNGLTTESGLDDFTMEGELIALVAEESCNVSLLVVDDEVLARIAGCFHFSKHF